MNLGMSRLALRHVCVMYATEPENVQRAFFLIEMGASFLRNPDVMFKE
jgi:hypothetical protein